jgi:hypothetical protein
MSLSSKLSDQYSQLGNKSRRILPPAQLIEEGFRKRQHFKNNRREQKKQLVLLILNFFLPETTLPRPALKV